MLTPYPPSLTRRLQLNMADRDQPLQQLPEWDRMWQQKTTPWDRSEPNPALTDALNEKSIIIGPSTQSGRRKKVLIPGCGRGYDVLLFASHGYDAYGMDVSQTAVDACQENCGDDSDSIPMTF